MSNSSGISVAFVGLSAAQAVAIINAAESVGANAAAPTPAAPTPSPTPAPAAAAPTPPAPAAGAAPAAPAPSAAPPPPAPATLAPAATGPSAADVTARIQQLAAQPAKGGAGKVREILQLHHATSAKDLKPEMFASAIQHLDAALAA